MNTHKKTVRDVEVRGKKVLLRCDFNVPQDWKIALDFYAYGMTGLLLENCRQRDLDRQELADQLFRLLSGEMVRPPET